MGVAIDYRLRLCFAAAAEPPLEMGHMVCQPRHRRFALLIGDPKLPKALVAELGASIVWRPSARRRSQPAGAFFGQLGDFLRQERPHERRLDSEAEDRLCRFCFVLGLYDELYRSRAAWSGAPLLGLSPGATTDELLSLCTPVAAADLAAMANAFIASQPQLLRGDAILNPAFAYGGGADGDLIVDGCYVDIKAVRDPKRAHIGNGPGSCSATRSWTTTTVTVSAAWGCTCPGSRSS